MPLLSTSKLPVPQSPEEFEKLATELAGRMEGCRFQRNGRRGQPQNGVDAFAIPESGGVLGVQHKNVLKLTASLLRTAIVEAESFEPPLARFVIMTSAPRDAKLQREVRAIDLDRRDRGRFRVTVMFWEDVCEELSGHRDIAEKYYSTLISERSLGEKRVASWVREVVNPWLECLDQNARYLARHDLTWRFYNRRLEHVHGLRAWISSDRAAEDFLRANPGLVPLVGEHERLCAAACATVAAICDELASSADFKAAVFARLDIYNIGRDRPWNPGGSAPLEALPMLVAQHIANKERGLQATHSDQEFWARFGSEFSGMLSEARASELHVAVLRLSEHARDLRKTLADLHFDLCNRYGVSPSP